MVIQYLPINDPWKIWEFLWITRASYDLVPKRSGLRFSLLRPRQSRIFGRGSSHGRDDERNDGSPTGENLGLSLKKTGIPPRIDASICFIITKSLWIIGIIENITPSSILFRHVEVSCKVVSQLGSYVGWNKYK